MRPGWGGKLHYAETAAGLVAILVEEPLPFDPAEAAREIRPLAGAAVASVAHALDNQGVPLPPSLRRWGVGLPAAADDLEPPEVSAIVIDRAMHLALRWRCDDLAVFVSFSDHGGVTVVTPWATGQGEAPALTST